MCQGRSKPHGSRVAKRNSLETSPDIAEARPLSQAKHNQRVMWHHDALCGICGFALPCSKKAT